MSITKPESVVIIGAGVTGLSTAFHLVEKGVESVVIVDKGTVGCGSSLQAGGIVTMLMPKETAIRARAISIDLFERFSKMLDGYQYHQVGCMNLFTTQEISRVAKHWDLQKKLGASFEILNGREITDRFPDIEVNKTDYGILDLRGGYSEPHKYIPALKTKLDDMGVVFRENEPVTGFEIFNSQINSIITKKETIKADAVVCTINAWTNHLLSPVGFEIPYKNFVHERFVTKPLSKPIQLPVINDNIFNSYIRPTEDNRLLVGTGNHDSTAFEMHGPNFSVDELEPDPRALPYIKEKMTNRTQILKEVDWDYHTVGLISLSQDVQPVIGPVPNIKGLYVGTNFHSGGFAYNPVSGLLIAEHVVDDKTRFNTDIYSPNRFVNFDTEGFLSKPLMHSEIGNVRH